MLALGQRLPGRYRSRNQLLKLAAALGRLLRLVHPIGVDRDVSTRCCPFSLICRHAGLTRWYALEVDVCNLLVRRINCSISRIGRRYDGYRFKSHCST
jgi:hypothetical protein